MKRTPTCSESALELLRNVETEAIAISSQLLAHSNHLDVTFDTTLQSFPRYDPLKFRSHVTSSYLVGSEVPERSMSPREGRGIEWTVVDRHRGGEDIVDGERRDAREEAREGRRGRKGLTSILQRLIEEECQNISINDGFEVALMR